MLVIRFGEIEGGKSVHTHTLNRTERTYTNTYTLVWAAAAFPAVFVSRILACVCMLACAQGHFTDAKVLWRVPLSGKTFGQPP